ncbi:S41 family peptidase [Sinomicrobium weinanense]|uniref:Peptidase n=1 Tax=Sinomicrobium weinanense TaxID=2842200 RepID=A0A926JTD2_9FLAO|nr:S41 family peptidase [Sinomicrobium weinanense]MBC9796908.1 peptidase [Sinomicrobium weinanense]MBU3124216.1 peptidase [Sinomicrobium weinanense]
MKYLLVLLWLVMACPVFSQSVDDHFPRSKMRKDLELFKKIRISANSGLYKYRSEEETDSIYAWAEDEIERSESFRDFFNVIVKLTDFEGSLHNGTSLPKKYGKALKAEQSGYFPYPVKLVEDKWILNIKDAEIPLGAEIISVNDRPVKEIMPHLYKYYTTDGINITGKSIGINYSFSKYYRLNYGRKNTFKVCFIPHGADSISCKTLKSTSYKAYYKNIKNRYSRSYDEGDYKDWEEEESYAFKNIDRETAILTVHSFSLGDKTSPGHLRYARFLDSVFTVLKERKTKNLILDVRHNGGGTDPNDLVTYSYLTDRNFVENRQAWISFNKVPYLRYVYSKIPAFLRPFGAGKYKKMLREEFPLEKDGKFYETETSEDHKVRTPKENAFTGKVYLLISPRVASAGSLFAAMVAGNRNTVTVGEEAMGGYYGHNGHTSMTYILPKSKLEISFSIVNLEQDVPEKKNQVYNRGIIPDYTVKQTFEDYLEHKDTQMEFVLELIAGAK